MYKRAEAPMPPLKPEPLLYTQTGAIAFMMIVKGRVSSLDGGMTKLNAGA
jgi:hypothetical protein